MANDNKPDANKPTGNETNQPKPTNQAPPVDPKREAELRRLLESDEKKRKNN
jgi:hypothetical protein